MVKKLKEKISLRWQERREKKEKAQWPYYAHKVLEEYNDSRKRQKTDAELTKAKRISFYILTSVLFILTALYAVIFCRSAYIRIWQSLKDFGISIAYYATLFVKSYEIVPTLNNIPESTYVSFLPETWEGFRELINAWWDSIFVGENFRAYSVEVLLLLEKLSPMLLPAVMLVFILMQIPDMILEFRNVKWLQKTRTLKMFENVKYKLYFPCKKYIKDYILWHRGYCFYNLLGFIWLCNLNVVSVIIAFFAWYFYFAKAFDFANLYIQIVKLSIDLLIFLDCSFGVLTVFIIVHLFNLWRSSFATKLLLRHQDHNTEFAESLPTAVLVCGWMGLGKTKFITSLGLKFSFIFRNRTLKGMFKYVMYFPDFPWDKLDKIILAQIKKHKIFNIASCEYFFEKEQGYFDRNPLKQHIYGYDIDNFPLYHSIGNKDVYIWDAIRTYSELYTIYFMTCSLLVANYSVREDYIIENCGNFITYHYDFISTPVSEENSHFAHILNWDALRMGKTLVKDSEYKDSFEFGVLMATELGKERENSLETQHLKKDDEACNAKNDLLASRIMYIRHGATVDNFCFAVLLSDEQRAMKLDINIRANCEQIILSSCSKPKLAYPLYFVESLIYDVFVARFSKFFWEYKKAKGNRGLFITILLYLCSVVYCRYEDKYARYGYSVLKFYRDREDLAGKQEAKEEEYYLDFAEIHNDRYKTDTHARFIRARALKSGIGLMDFPTYEGLEATDEELHAQASFHISNIDYLNGGS